MSKNGTCESSLLCSLYVLTPVFRITQYKRERDLSYVFVAYTAEQFQSTEDLRALHQIADAAARNAGVISYWIGCSCMPDPSELSQDVYRICDIIRVSMILARRMTKMPTDTVHRELSLWSLRLANHRMTRVRSIQRISCFNSM
jgi:hypothetical protein